MGWAIKKMIDFINRDIKKVRGLVANEKYLLIVKLAVIIISSLYVGFLVGAQSCMEILLEKGVLQTSTANNLLGYSIFLFISFILAYFSKRWYERIGFGIGIAIGFVSLIDTFMDNNFLLTWPIMLFLFVIMITILSISVLFQFQYLRDGKK